jgi:hypothetical protein
VISGSLPQFGAGKWPGLVPEPVPLPERKGRPWVTVRLAPRRIEDCTQAPIAKAGSVCGTRLLGYGELRHSKICHIRCDLAATSGQFFRPRCKVSARLFDRYSLCLPFSVVIVIPLVAEEPADKIEAKGARVFLEITIDELRLDRRHYILVPTPFDLDNGRHAVVRTLATVDYRVNMNIRFLA